MKAKSTNFDSWAVTFTGTKDHDYLQAKLDISAYEVFERLEPAPHRRTQRAATHPVRQITGDGASTPERSSKACAQNTMQTIVSCVQNTMQTTTQTIQAPTEKIDPQTITHQSGEDTRDPTGKTSSMEQTTTHQNEGEDNEGITRTRRSPREISMTAIEKTPQEGTPRVHP